MGSKKTGKSKERKDSTKKVEKVASPNETDDVVDDKDDCVSAETMTTTESAKGKTRGKRTVAAMYKVVVKKALGKKFKVTYSDTGNPNGRTRHTLQSYIGMLVRTMVPINVESWPEVDPDLKANIWTDIQDTFKVAPESRKLVLSSAGVKWRYFKTTLTRKYVLPFLGKKKKLRKPPKQYSYVGLQPWKEFVKQRTSEEWLKLHQKQSERVRKRKYHHRLSRKGYLGLEEELKRKLPEGEIIDRAIMWKKARIPKNGKIDEELSLVAAKIDELLEKKSKGELEISGSSDVLSQALDTPEHSGRVRGVGGFVNPSSYFNLPKKKRIRITKADILARDKERDKELEETKKMLIAQQAKTEAMLYERIAQLEALVTGKTAMHPPATGDNVISPISDKGSFHDKSRIDKSDHNDAKVMENVEECDIIPTPGKGVGVCELAVDNINNIVAFGSVFEEGELSKTLHGVPLKEGTVRVSVDGILKPDAVLPFPIEGEMEFVREALGSHVAWPDDLVVRTMFKKKKKNPQFVKSLFDQVEINPWVPKRCKLLYKHATTIMKETGSSISTVFSKEVFGEPTQLFILSENVINLLEMQWIGQGVIAAYEGYLHELITERDLLDTFAFVDPAATYNCQRPDFVRYLVDRLKEGKSDRIFFMPYNPGKHWILTILWEGEIYMLDPLPKPIHYKEWETSVMNAVKTFNAETGRVNKLPKVKPLPGVPKQPGGVECGYYVMRYMKEIIEDETLSFPTKWAVKTRKSYSQAQIDEVRIEVADYIQSWV
ncbi:hypothetical protein ABKV19_017226 [Rosa sericea]